MNDTMQHVQTYEYYKLPGNRVMIVSPMGLKVTYPKCRIEFILRNGNSPYREMSAHERIMFENALKVFEEG